MKTIIACSCVAIAALAAPGCRHGTVKTPESRNEVPSYSVHHLPAAGDRIIGAGFFEAAPALRSLAGERTVKVVLHGLVPGTLERELTVERGYGGPILISLDDARALGLGSSGTDVVLVSADGRKETRREAGVRMDIPSANYSRDVLVAWPIPPGPDASAAAGKSVPENADPR